MLITEYVLKNLKEVGRHTDDQTKGLHLWIKPNQRKYWIFRFTSEGKRFNMSLGGFPEIGLKQALRLALCRDLALGDADQIAWLRLILNFKPY